jgi:hypothetical protein
MARKKHQFNTERERLRRLAVTRLLDTHDEAMQELRLRISTETPADQAVALESLRSKTASELIGLLYRPDYSTRDAMRSCVQELMQLADDVLTVNEEAEELGKSIELASPQAVRVEWDQEDFGKLMTKLGKVRLSYVLAGAVVGPALATRIAEHEVDRLFGSKPAIPPRSNSESRTTTVTVEAPRTNASNKRGAFTKGGRDEQD